jgi:xanthine/CO dehydrogenase XdhC/CoxF family maturation factor
MTQRELDDMIDLAERLLAADEVAVLATLFRANGSTYRELGSMMVSGPAPACAGGVSGGCVEEYVARHGRTLVQQRPAAMLSFDADPDAADGGKPSLGCGGSIEVLVERIGAAHVEFLRRLREARRADTSSAAVCVIDTSDPRAIGVRRTWAEGHSFADARLEPIRLAAAETMRSRHDVLGPGERALVHYVLPMTRLVVLGAGDDVRPLCTLARSLGWHVTVADRRRRLATRARFPDANEVIAAEWPAALSRITFTPRTAVVMMTHSLADDVEILPLLASKPSAYVGALGPPHRRRWVLDGAREIAPIPDAFAARFRGPIGLNLGDRSPAGIAVSIVSEILAELNGRGAAPLSCPAPLIGACDNAELHA